MLLFQYGLQRNCWYEEQGTAIQLLRSRTGMCIAQADSEVHLFVIVAIGTIDVIRERIATSRDGERRLVAEVVICAAGISRDVQFDGRFKLSAVGIFCCARIDVDRIPALIHCNYIEVPCGILNNAHVSRGRRGNIHPDIFDHLAVLYDGVVRPIVKIIVENVNATRCIHVSIGDIGNVIISIVLRLYFRYLCACDLRILHIVHVKLFDLIEDVVKRAG